MAFTVKFWSSFNKRINSTEIPTTSGTSITVVLKENCSEHDPVLQVNTSDASYTYAYIALFGKYYFVTDVVFVANNYFEYHLTEDVLASYRGVIGQSYFNLMYGPASIQDKYIIDSRAQTKASRTMSFIRKPALFDGSDRYLITVYNQIPSSSFTTTYIMTPNQLDNFKAWLTDPDIFASLSRYINGDPLPLIVSCRWIPYSFTAGQTASATVMVGNNTMHDGNGNPVTMSVLVGNPIIGVNVSSFALPVSTSYKDYPPYTTMSLYLPGVGPVEINPADYALENTIYISLYIEGLTGCAKYILKNTLGGDNLLTSPVQTFDCNLSAEIPLAQTSRDVAGVTTGITSTIGGAATLVAGIAATVASEGAASPLVITGTAQTIGGITNTAIATMKHSSSVSGNYGSSIFRADMRPSLMITQIDTEDQYSSLYISQNGTPTSGVHYLGDLSGYIKCINASIICNASGREKQEINDFLNGGFYLDLT